MTIPEITGLSDIQLDELKRAIYEEEVIRRLESSKPETFQKVILESVSRISVENGLAFEWHIRFNGDVNFVVLDLEDTFYSAMDNTLLKYRRIRVSDSEIWYTLEPLIFVKKSGHAYTDGLGSLGKLLEDLDENANVIEMVRCLINGINVYDVERDHEEELWEWLEGQLEYFKKGQEACLLSQPSEDGSHESKWSLLRFMMGS